MNTETSLARILTDTLLAAEGVTAVFPVKAIRQAAIEGIAVALDIPGPDILVDVDQSADVLTITAHIGGSLGHPTPQTLATAAEALKRTAAAHGNAHTMIFVKARLIAAAPRPEPA